MPATPIDLGTYAAGLQKWQRGEIPITTPGELKLLITGEDYVPNKESHTNLTDITDEAYGDEWPQGGVTLTNVDVLIDTPNNRTYLQFDPLLVERASFPGGRRMVIYHAAPVSDTEKTLFIHGVFEQPIAPVYGPVAIAAPDGVFRTGY